MKIYKQQEAHPDTCDLSEIDAMRGKSSDPRPPCCVYLCLLFHNIRFQVHMGASLNGVATSLHIFGKCIMVLLPFSRSLFLCQTAAEQMPWECYRVLNTHTGADVAYCFPYKTKFYMAFSVVLHLSFLFGPIVWVTNSIYLT